MSNKDDKAENAVSNSNNNEQVDPEAADTTSDPQNAILFPEWICLVVFSSVCFFASATKPYAADSDGRGSAGQLAIAVSGLSAFLSIVMTVSYILLRTRITKWPLVEGILTAVLVTLWAVALPVIMGPSNDLAVTLNAVTDANLYFSSWLCILICMRLALKGLQESMNIDVAQQADSKQARWLFLVAFSFVVMVASARIFSSSAAICDGREKFCRRLKLAISLGLMSGLASLGVTLALFKQMVSPMIEFGVSFIVVTFWTFGIGYITFGGSESPGATISNLYFATWISFLLSVTICSTCVPDVLGMTPSDDENEQPAIVPFPEDDGEEDAAPPEQQEQQPNEQNVKKDNKCAIM